MLLFGLYLLSLLIMKSAVRQLLAQKSLSEAECESLFSQLGQADEVQQAIIFSLMAAKGESILELLAAREFVLKHAIFEQSLLKDCPENTIDLVGTGGDEIGTFNISTAASLVVASCGVYVAKHGGGRSTSLSGSADVVTALGIPAYQTSGEVINSLHQHHYAYLRAPYFNEFLGVFAGLRKKLGFPTMLNVLGPLVNPLRLKRQVIGVYRHSLLPVVAGVLHKTGSTHALVVHGSEGLDELSVSGLNHVIEICDGEMKPYVIDPQALGFAPSMIQDVVGGSAAVNAEIIQAIFSGTLFGPKRDIVILNAAAGLLVADKVATLQDGITMAREAIASGNALALLHQLQQGLENA